MQRKNGASTEDLLTSRSLQEILKGLFAPTDDAEPRPRRTVRVPHALSQCIAVAGVEGKDQYGTQDL